KEKKKSLEITTVHLDDSMLKTPALAIDLARSEISRMAKLIGRMLTSIIIPFISDKKHMSNHDRKNEETQQLINEIPTRDQIFPDLTLLEGIDLREHKIDFLEREISTYLTKIARRNISKEQAQEVFGMISIAKDMESIGDIIHRNMIPLIAKKKELLYDFCEEGKEELLIYQSKVIKQINLLEKAFSSFDLEVANKIMNKERKYLDLESKYRATHLQRIISKKRESIETSEIHMELMDLMKQILLYSSNIAQTYSGSTPEKMIKSAV
ncbi:MAG: Na/Pi cotransporter family protein, partial [Desulfobacteraceae bacterium]|nr:Na/Pi cotransporter family protein [Desulfobacteraceae bacterium]